LLGEIHVRGEVPLPGSCCSYGYTLGGGWWVVGGGWSIAARGDAHFLGGPWSPAL
jgi:hypothetical protein